MSEEVVFISGASRGIGTAIAEHFANKGHKVIGTSRSNFTFDSDNSNLIPLSLDITNRDSVNECMNYLKENNLTPSILINNAGITSDQLFLRMKDEDWDNVIATNLTGTFNLTKALIKGMIKNRYGRIINISSVSGLMGNPGQVNYSSAKAGLSGFTKSLAKEVGSRGITVNSIAPGFIETDMTSYLDENAKEKLTQDIPLKRLGSVNDIAELAIFLASDESSYITGQTISVDGGLFMY
ncbi:3-oxoacyl-[acyl-carrier-protein] reductase [Gammaproteobacteria bacterium]|jgi:3-oxoacyl-[acyl-carrier protein] reductase|nr:3-oxoacyl-[acyl-carrier-protein] reductase [Gammaproteobacteria bacterium]MDC3313490.1 3-oxoacyl-[acyl-carrier-protein] reductase [Gammaproteobacteria bacterium]MDC3368269.1 3-oxoacyl-[acyl-carrier-protein] reductase [Gammaproteobacteria bacterium]|tara:strand:+ start:537 stop:1253 length:717 start_codon:yes stop_codon:yes gene_type:complete